MKGGGERRNGVDEIRGDLEEAKRERCGPLLTEQDTGNNNRGRGEAKEKKKKGKGEFYITGRCTGSRIPEKRTYSALSL